MNIGRIVRTILILPFALATSSLADYDSNAAGKITHILTYSDASFLIQLDSMPAGPCGSYFEVPAIVSAEGKQALLARALTAYAGSETVTIGYDGTTCDNGHYRIYRIG